MRFDGPDYSKDLDKKRLSKQHVEIKEFMLKEKNWFTLKEISSNLNFPEASVSAQLRHLRKPRFGSYVVERRRTGNKSRGLFEYRVLPPGTESIFEIKTKIRKPLAEKIKEIEGFCLDNSAHFWARNILTILNDGNL